MPTSFSRILNEDDLTEVRNQYLAALQALDDDEKADEKADEKPDETADQVEDSGTPGTASTD